MDKIVTDYDILYLNHATELGRALHDVAVSLEQMDWVVREFDLSSRSGWLVSELGKQHVQYHQKLVGIGNALRRRDDVALTDLTSYGLLCALLDADWKLHCVANGGSMETVDPARSLQRSVLEGAVRALSAAHSVHALLVLALHRGRSWFDNTTLM